MIRFFSLSAIVLALLVTGCSSSDSTNIMESADQAAIDAYDAQVAADEAARSGAKDIK